MSIRNLKSLARRTVSADVRAMLRKAARRVVAGTSGRRLTEDEFRDLLRRLRLTPGRTALVHCSFGRLRPEFSPAIAVSLLKEAVGEHGTLLMPCYPGNADEWIQSGGVFDATDGPFATGALAAAFARSAGVKMSTHPVKALAAWGQDAEFLTATHQLSRTPFDRHSPYAKMLEINDSIAVGLGTRKMSFFHCCEDAVPTYAQKLYTAEPVLGHCRTSEGDMVKMATHIHRAEVLGGMESSYAFLTRTACPDYHAFEYRGRHFYVADTQEVYVHVTGVIRQKSLAAGAL